MTTGQKQLLGGAIIVLLAACYYFDRRLALIAIDVLVMAYGLVGAARRRIDVKGRGLPARTFVGGEAVFIGLLLALIGGALALFEARR